MLATIQHLILRLRIHIETHGRVRLGPRIKRRQDPEAQRQVWRRASIARPLSGRVCLHDDRTEREPGTGNRRHPVKHQVC
jgi:hypothetical protein